MTAQRSAPVIALVLATACTGSTPESDYRAPAADLITVFYPTYDGTVYGRGLPGAISDPSLQVAMISASLSATKVVTDVRPDGSFDFNLLASALDTLEIRGQVDSTEQSEVGPSTFFRVPNPKIDKSKNTCCIDQGASSGYCEPEDDRNNRIGRGEEKCPVDMGLGLFRPCLNDNECGALGSERVLLDRSQVQLTAPNEQGLIEVSGTTAPNALVTLENRQLNGVGVRTRISHTARITGEDGSFRFPSVTARGDDELVLQVLLLNGYRSAPTSFKVPDSEMVGVDVVGAEAWEGARVLQNGVRGTVALYIAPYGRDNRGICPDSAGDPATCYTGGLTHEMIDFINEGEDKPTIDDAPANPTPTVPQPANPGLAYNRGWTGDVRAPAQDVVIVLDMSTAAAAADPGGLRFDHVRRLVEDLRARDRVGVVLFGGSVMMGYEGSVGWRDPNNPQAVVAKVGVQWIGVSNDRVGQSAAGLRTASERQVLLDGLNALNDDAAASNGADLADGIRSGLAMLEAARSVNGRIVAIAATKAETQEGKLNRSKGVYDANHLDELIDLTDASPREGRPNGIPVTLVDINDAEAANYWMAREVVAFSGGDNNDGALFETSTSQLEGTLLEVRRRIAGSFLLLYDMCIPKSAGKTGVLEFRLRARVPFQEPDGRTRTVSIVSPPIGQKPYAFNITVAGSTGCNPQNENCDVPCPSE